MHAGKELLDRAEVLARVLVGDLEDRALRHVHQLARAGLVAVDLRLDLVRGVQEPAQLAAWLLEGQDDKDGQPWTLEKVDEAMDSGPDNHQVNLKTPVPIVIFYMTAEVEEDGHVHFFDDIYGYDADLEKVLEKGPPYPIKPDPAAPKLKAGDTA